MRVRTALAGFLLLAALAPQSAGQERPEAEPAQVRFRKTIVFLGSDSNPPLLFRDANGTPKGFVVDLLQALGRQGGFEVVFDLLPHSEWSRAFHEGRGDIMGVEPESEAARGTIPVVPLWTVRELVLFPVSRAVAPRSLADLAHDTVAVVDASPQHVALLDVPVERRPDIATARTIGSALRKLRQGEVTAVLGHSLAVRQTPEYAEAPRLGETELRVVPYFLATRPGGEALQPLFTAAYL